MGQTWAMSISEIYAIVEKDADGFGNGQQQQQKRFFERIDNWIG